jgi:hypothetical protein
MWSCCVGRTGCEDATLSNGWSEEGSRYTTYKAGRLRLGQEPGLGHEIKVLELPKRRLRTRQTRENQSIKESIQEVA